MSVATTVWDVAGWTQPTPGRAMRSAKSRGRRAGRRPQPKAQQQQHVDQLASAHTLVEQAARSLQQHLEQEAGRWAHLDRVLEAVAELPDDYASQAEHLQAMREQLHEQHTLHRSITNTIDRTGSDVRKRGQAWARAEREVLEGPIGQLASQIDPARLESALTQMAQAAMRQQELLERLSERQIQMQASMQELYEHTSRQMMTLMLVGWLMLVIGAGVAGSAGLSLTQGS